MFRKLQLTRITLLALLMVCPLWVFAQKDGHTLSITVTEKGTREAIIMATLHLQPSGAMAVTNADGQAKIENVPTGEYTLQISYVGFEPITTKLKVTKDLQLTYQMVPTSLALKEVQVVARQKVSGASTSSVVSRQAIDHLQATSLADIMQLIPGQKMGNIDLTQQSNLQLRTLVNNNTSAFGASIVVDGMPISNNGSMSKGPLTEFTGTDLRQISADDIDNVEIVRGIPSAEYGDLTSGLVVVHSKVGVTPYQVKAKITPALQNYSVGKGFNLGSAGIINVSADYAKAWGDPRKKTRSFDRYTVNLGYGKDLSSKWHTDTKLRFMSAKDWSGNDPDVIDDGTSWKNTTTTFSLTHNGRIRMDMPLMRSLKYTLGVSISQTDSRTTSYVANSSGLQPILTAMETGYYNVPWMTTSYLATGITESRPGNVFFKIGDDFFWRKGKTVQSFKLGADYHYDWNSGKGYYNEDPLLPFKPNADGRPRAFSDIPGLHQVAAYAEDQFTWEMNKTNRLRVGFGLRFTALQPFSNVSTTALSPRLNVAFSLTKWLDIRGGIGMNSKTPGLNYLYPENKYTDRVAANYMPQDGSAQVLNYYTHVYPVEYSANLKNATTTKVEAGIDVKLPGNRRLSVLAYQDKTPNGFSTLTDYYYYTYNYYTLDATHPTMNNPANTETRGEWITTGMIGNTTTIQNKGVEFDFELGELKPLRTSFYFSGAWSETKTWSTDLTSRSVPNAYLPTSYTSVGATPFKVVYPSELDYYRYRRFINTLRAVTHIPSLNMVASFTAQVIWHDSDWDYIADKEVIGYITPDLVYHPLNGEQYIAFDGGQVSVSDLAIRNTDKDPNERPITWNLAARLTKELGKVGGFSLYVNNALFYEPFLKGNKTTTLSQRNTGTFQFGAELYLNL